jgi:hypothetical protein
MYEILTAQSRRPAPFGAAAKCPPSFGSLPVPPRRTLKLMRHQK